MIKSKASRNNKFIRIITIPFRAFCKARDFYVRSMMDCANRNIIGLHGTSQAPGLPRSFSVISTRSNESDEDNRELIRATSARNIFSGIDLDDYYVRQETKMKSGSSGGGGGGPRAMPPRSISVAMGRIDEDRPCCYFGGDDHVNNINVRRELKYHRSKSHAVTSTSYHIAHG
ncbi:hypothetical protein OROGR_016421 [Orobanche gracilis]